MMLTAENLSLSYGTQRVLDGVSLTLAAGESIAVMGPSGSGKSSLLAILGCMAMPDGGSYRIRERDMLELPAREQARFRGEQLGFVFQSSYLLPHMSVLDNLLLAVEHLPGSLKPWRTRALQLLEQMGIAELAQRRPHQISGGQAQRAAIARALMRDPALILADEPTGSLDQDSAAAVLELLTGLTRAGKAVLVVTHSAEVARALTRTVTLREGRLAAAV